MPTGMDACAQRIQPPVGPFDPDAPDESAAHRRDGGFVVRLGLAGVKGIGQQTAERIGALTGFTGMLLSFYVDVAWGATIVLTQAFVFLVVLAAMSLLRQSERRLLHTHVGYGEVSDQCRYLLNTDH